MKGLFRFRRQNPGQVWAWATYDFANSAYSTTILSVVFSTYYAGVVAGGAEGTRVFGVAVPGASMFSLFMAASTVLIAVISPVLGAISDRGGLKKGMLGLHVAVGVLATGLLYTVGPGNWLWGGMLLMVSQVGFAGGNVFYNAMLYDVAEPEDFGKVSGLGWAWGYIGGGVLLAVNLVMLQFPQLLGLPQGYFSVQDCFLSVAIWWALFSLPVFRAVPSTRTTNAPQALGASLRESLAGLKSVLRRLRELPHFTRFFIAYLLFNDGIETVIVMASIFGNQELHMTSADLIQFFLMIQFLAFFGSLFFGWLADLLGNKVTILVSLVGWTVIVLWAWQIGIFGNAVREFWMLGVLTALVMGGSQAASRSLQALLIPESRSAEFFSFFGISGKFASATGPLVLGLAVFLTGSIRVGVLSLAVFFVAGFVLLLRVNEAEGHRQAQQFE